MIPPLQLLDVSFASPARNLACDEALLDELEAGHGAPTLRFWESPEPFVVVGYANKLATEVNVEACNRLNVPMLRRSSGGGAVVQGYGCLNYNLTLPITDETANITDTNCFVMRRLRDAFSKLLGGSDVQIQGHTDLTIPATGKDGGPASRLKFSGNAQRRKSRALVFHGCFLLGEFDLSLIDRLLLHPTREPEYRGSRKHGDFVTRLACSRDEIKTALGAVWKASEKAATPSHIRIEALVAERFGNREWTEKF